MRVAQRASGGGAGSSLLSLGLLRVAWAGWATAMSWAWLLLSAWAEMREGGTAGWAGLRKKGKGFSLLIICDLGNLGRGILAEAWKSSKWDLR